MFTGPVEVVTLSVSGDSAESCRGAQAW
jgi:hypothetical protein